LRADVGGVDEGDAGVDRPMDDLDALVVVLGAVFAEHRVAEAQLAHRDAGAPERSEFQWRFVPLRRWLSVSRGRHDLVDEPYGVQRAG
jgi:hypothetical protein